MIVRILLILVLLYLAWRLFRLARSHFTARESSTAEHNNLRVSSVRCAQCGLFLPEPDALFHKGRYFCSREHRDAMNDNGVSS